MARIRSIHPDVCVSPTMAALSGDLERTFFRLLTHCDDQGRAVDNTLLIKAALYPLHEDVTAESLEAELRVLAGRGLIHRYEVAGQRLLCVTSWDEYQHPQRPTKEKLPPPPAPIADAYASPPRVAVQPHGGDIGARGLEGRGDCADMYASTPAYLEVEPNPEALSLVRDRFKQRSDLA